MLGVLNTILCWIKQIGAMVLNAGIDGVNAFVYYLATFIQTMIDAWPIAMPDLPDLPEGLQTAFAWVKWTPLPVHQGILLLLFACTVWLAWTGIAVILRWAKVVE